MPSNLSHGDRVELAFNPPIKVARGRFISKTKGDILKDDGKTFVVNARKEGDAGRPRVIRVDDHPGVTVVAVEKAEVKEARLRVLQRGALMFQSPGRTAQEIEDQLNALAKEIALRPKSFRRGGRRDELMLQFHDIADHIELSYPKRAYLLERAKRLNDFHPWKTKDAKTKRTQTLRPMPVDFDLNPLIRNDRDRRLKEMLDVFGSAEQEVRKIASGLNIYGYHARRPHPQAQELIVDFTHQILEMNATAQVRVFPSKAGEWQCVVVKPRDKLQARAVARMQRDGQLSGLVQLIKALLPY